eukprot:jgi/Chrzof1/14595/Cz09g08230.t1
MRRLASMFKSNQMLKLGRVSCAGACVPCVPIHARRFQLRCEAQPYQHVCKPLRSGFSSLQQHFRTVASQASRQASVTVAEQYGADQIQVLEGLEPVRKRPGMYIGSTGSRGLHHLVWEVLDNAVDEVQGGHATRVDLEIDTASGWVTVTDNGRGIPTGIHPRTGKSALETVLTVLHAGGKFGGQGSGYSVSGGLHGVGISVVNALSELLEITVWRDGMKYSQQYSRGAAVSSLSSEPLYDDEQGRTGTQVQFLYDSTIFSPSAALDTDTISSRLRELAFLNSSAVFRLKVTGSNKQRHHADSSSSSNGTSSGSSSVFEHANHVNGSSSSSISSSNGTGSSIGNGTGSSSARDDGWQVFHYEGGLQEYVTWLNRDKHVLHEPIVFTNAKEGVEVGVALQWCADAFSDTMMGFANSIKTIDGGSHMDGLKTALTKLINNMARKNKVLKEGDPNMSGDHVREGLGAIISVKVPSPEFEGQTKTRLGNPEVRKIVETLVVQDVGEWLEQHPPVFNAIAAKALQAARAAEAAKKARELVRRKNVLTRSTLPGKLADCTSTNREETEIFIVEGDSAGGSAKQARDRRFQAILPLRGKILNVERKDDAALYKNQEISALIVALGLGSKGGPDSGSDGKSLRYGKVILLTDADVDGAHIRTLLLTFLFRYRRELFEAGRVYVAVPPLYRIEVARGSKRIWAYSDQELRRVLDGLPAGPSSATVTRFKGLGEMEAVDLWDTTLDPAKRLLRRLTLEDAAGASHMFTLLMGDRVAPRRQLIEEHGGNLGLQQLDI